MPIRILYLPSVSGCIKKSKFRVGATRFVSRVSGLQFLYKNVTLYR